MNSRRVSAYCSVRADPAIDNSTDGNVPAESNCMVARGMHSPPSFLSSKDCLNILLRNGQITPSSAVSDITVCGLWSRVKSSTIKMSTTVQGNSPTPSVSVSNFSCWSALCTDRF